MNPLVETWQIHNRINAYLLESIDATNLKDISLSKGRNVGEQFAHMHNVRLMWLKVADVSLLDGLAKIEKENITKDNLLTGLQLSGKAIEQLFEKATDGKIRGFKPHAAAFPRLFDLARVASPRTSNVMSETIRSSGRSKNTIRFVGMGDKMTIQTAGYSGTPLAKKLGIKEGFHISLVNAPEYYMELFTDLPGNLYFNDKKNDKIDFIHFFTKSKDEYEALLSDLRDRIKPNGMIWISWPKKASKVVTDITEDIIRNFALRSGLVDIKVCAVDDTWSGLKLVIPVKDRN
jgi:hypothetical protein